MSRCFFRSGLGRDLLTQIVILLKQVDVLLHFIEHSLDGLKLEGLEKIVESAEAHRLDGIFHARKGGRENDDRLGVAVFCGFENFQTALELRCVGRRERGRTDAGLSIRQREAAFSAVKISLFLLSSRVLRK